MEASPIPRRVYAALAVSVVAYASSSILVRLAGDTAPSVSLVALRAGIAVVLLAPFCAPAAWRERGHLRPAGWAALAGAGVLLAVHFALWFESLRHTSVASSTVLVSTTPLWLAAFEVVRGRALSRALVAALLVGMAGAALLGVVDSSGASAGTHPLLGNGLALASALSMALYLTVGQRLRQHLSWGAYVWPLFALVAAFTAGYAASRGAPLAGLPWQTYGLCLLMALGPQIAGHGSLNYAVRFVSPLSLGLLSLVEPVGASLLAFVVWQEVPPPLGLAGMVVTLAGVAWAMRESARRAPTS